MLHFFSRKRRAQRTFSACLIALCLFSCLGTFGAERVKLIDDWKFRRGDADDPAWRFTWRHMEPSALITRDQLLPPGKRGKIPWDAPGFNTKTIRENYDDSSWETVDLPHDAAIGADFSYANDPMLGMLPCTEPVWYRKTFELSTADQGKTIAFDIDGAMSRSGVWINGHFAGGWAYGYTSFRVDATPYVKFGAKNTIVIRCANPPQSSRWYTGNGLYRNVWLVKSDPVRVARWGVFARTLSVEEGKAKIAISVDVERAVDEKNKEALNATVLVKAYRRDADGERIGEAFFQTPEKSISLKSGENNVLVWEELTIDDAPIWSPEQPNTCYLETIVSVGGKVVDVDETPFGIRTLRYDGKEGLFINEKNYRINGFCIHHELGALGAAYNEQAEKRRLLALKSIGCNAIRLSHNPSAPETVDQLARLGFIVQAEAFDQWKRPAATGRRNAGYFDLFDRWSEADIRSLVRRDRNCPAIVMWSIGNEIPELDDEQEFIRLAKTLCQYVHDEDPTRPTTSACNSAKSGSGDIPKVLDIFGFNYYGRVAYEKFHEQYPDIPVYGSETICTSSSRGWYVFPVVYGSSSTKDSFADFHPTSYAWYAFGFNHEKPLNGWACPPEYEFETQRRYPFVMGSFAWTGIDYLGAPFNIDELSRSQRFMNPENEARAISEKEEYGAPLCPLHVCDTGAFDTALFPKDIAYLYKSYWLPEEKTTHILPSWNWEGREGEITPVYVFTSGDSAELFLNDRSLGIRKKNEAEYQYRLVWDNVRYEPGVLRVVSYKNGEVWDEAIVETTGAPHALRLSVDRTTLKADGRDLSFATVEVIDQKGRVVPNAQIDVTFNVEGAGRFVAADSGNGCDLTSFSSPTRRTFSGLASAIVRSTRNESGIMTLSVSAEGLVGASVEIKTH